MEIDGPCRGKRGKISLNSLVIKILVQILAASQDTKSTDSPVVSQSGRFVFQEIYTKILLACQRGGTSAKNRPTKMWMRVQSTL